LDNEKLFEFMEKIYSELQTTNSKIDGIDNRLVGLEGEVKKNSIKLEVIVGKVDTITEIQESHMKQNERNHIEMVEMFNDKIDLTQSAVKKLSRDYR